MIPNRQNVNRPRIPGLNRQPTQIATQPPMKSTNLSLRNFFWSVLAAAAVLASAYPASAQLLAYDDAGNYQVNANWTNGANQGFGFTPWVITTNGPDNHGTYVVSGNSPVFVIASITSVLATNYTDIWGTYANGTNGVGAPDIRVVGAQHVGDRGEDEH